MLPRESRDGWMIRRMTDEERAFQVESNVGPSNRTCSPEGHHKIRIRGGGDGDVMATDEQSF